MVQGNVGLYYVSFSSEPEGSWMSTPPARMKVCYDKQKNICNYYIYLVEQCTRILFLAKVTVSSHTVFTGPYKD